MMNLTWYRLFTKCSGTLYNQKSWNILLILASRNNKIVNKLNSPASLFWIQRRGHVGKSSGAGLPDSINKSYVHFFQITNLMNIVTIMLSIYLTNFEKQNLFTISNGRPLDKCEDDPKYLPLHLRCIYNLWYIQSLASLS